MFKSNVTLLSLCLFVGLLNYHTTYALSKKQKTNRGPELQAGPLFDIGATSASDVEFFVSNYGILGMNPATPNERPTWPRGSDNSYVFGGGFWFATIKMVDSEPKMLTTMTYNPNNGFSWFAPGRIADGNEAMSDCGHTRNYRVYRSNDFRGDGTPLDPMEYTMWPLWDAAPNRTLQENGYLGTYIGDTNERSISVYPKGPVMLSDEDLYAVFKDTDLSRYDDPMDQVMQRGYPLNIEVEQFVYSYASEPLRDILILRYDMIHRGDDTLRDCWFAPVYDFDVAHQTNVRDGAGNDRVRVYDEDLSLNLAFQWTNGDQGETGMGFGYVGVAFLETPTVDENGFLRKDRPIYELEEQQGLKTFHNWILQQDPFTDAERYNFLASQQLDGDNGPGEKRFMISTGPFHMLPGDTARIAYVLAFASPAVGPEANGTTQDAAELVRVVQSARETYYENIVTDVELIENSSGTRNATAPYPNPAQDETRLDIALEQPQDVRIQLVSSVGSIVFSENHSLNAGAHTVAVRLANLAEGAYYIRIEAGGQTDTFPVTVLR